eukprot:762914-Hanusia_phi.AAC.5
MLTRRDGGAPTIDPAYCVKAGEGNEELTIRCLLPLPDNTIRIGEGRIEKQLFRIPPSFNLVPPDTILVSPRPSPTLPPPHETLRPNQLHVEVPSPSQPSITCLRTPPPRLPLVSPSSPPRLLLVSPSSLVRLIRMSSSAPRSRASEHDAKRHAPL